MSSFRDIVFDEGITTFEALDRLAVPDLDTRVDDIQTQLDMLDGNVRSLAATVDTQYRQTQNQILTINTSINTINLSIQDLGNQVNTLTNVVNEAKGLAQNASDDATIALQRANEAYNLANSFARAISDLQNDIAFLKVDTPRLIRPGNVIRIYRQLNESRSQCSTYIFPNVQGPYILSHTQYHVSTPSFPQSFVTPFTVAGAGDNSRNGITLDCARYRIREGPVTITLGNNQLSTPHFLVWVSESWPINTK